jgi:hypothetical protein
MLGVGCDFYFSLYRVPETGQATSSFKTALYKAIQKHLLVSLTLLFVINILLSYLNIYT